MAEHELVQYEPSFRKYVRKYDPEEDEWSTSYLEREGLIPGMNAPDAESNYECVCGEEFGTDEEAAENHVEELLEGENQR